MKLTYSLYRIEICPIKDLKLPQFIGAALRGAFGYAFKDITCVERNTSCQECANRHSCAYKKIFEPEATELGIEPIKGFKRLPRPFVIRPAIAKRKSYPLGEPLRFELVLIGLAQDYLSQFIKAFQKMCESGLGKEHVKCKLKSVVGLPQEYPIYSESNSEIKALPKERRYSIGSEFPLGRAEITFLSPFRFKRAGRLSTDLDFYTFASQLLRRISALGYFYGDGALPKDKMSSLLKISKDVKTVKSKLRWLELKRYSTRQKSPQKLGGVVGSITFEGELKPLTPYLVAGEDLHVGKGTTFGLGQYKLRPLSSHL